MAIATFSAGLLLAALCSTNPAPTPPTLGEAQIFNWDACQTFDAITGEPRIDAACFFDALIDRYRRLATYQDIANVSQVTRRAGEPDRRVASRIGCGIANGELRIETSASQVKRAVGLDLAPRTSPVLEEEKLKYQLWIAPHMALKYSEKPQRDLRAGVEEGFTATEAETVTYQKKKLVHLELKSGDGLSEDCEATFDLYVNPDSLLIERIEGQQRMPDGADYQTTLDITTIYAETSPAEVVESTFDSGSMTSPPPATITPSPPGPPSDDEEPAPVPPVAVPPAQHVGSHVTG